MAAHGPRTALSLTVAAQTARRSDGLRLEQPCDARARAARLGPGKAGAGARKDRASRPGCWISHHADRNDSPGLIFAFFTLQVSADALVFVSEAASLKDEHKAVLEAVQIAPRAIRLADKKYRADKEIMLTVVRQNGRMLREAAETLRGDEEVVRVAVSQFGQALEYASLDCRANFSLVLAAVRQDGWALHFASESCRRNLEVALAAVGQRPRAIRHVGYARRHTGILVYLPLQLWWYRYSYSVINRRCTQTCSWTGRW
eukprot:SAG31_NODE_4089_length_3600_cov_8.534704_1_plen_259_part_00